MSDAASRPFWQRKALTEMSREEWESLCDGCARCCLVKLESGSEAAPSWQYTSVVCDLLDRDACRCTRYPERHELVPDCVELGPEQAVAFRWLPRTCAYRILAEGGDLPQWHPLVSGDADTVHAAGISVRGKVVPQSWVHPEGLEEHVIRWVEI